VSPLTCFCFSNKNPPRAWNKIYSLRKMCSSCFLCGLKTSTVA
jgi:hypothetical protein